MTRLLLAKGYCVKTTLWPDKQGKPRVFRRSAAAPHWESSPQTGSTAGPESVESTQQRRTSPTSRA